MARELIGAGGWGYFASGLPAYAKAFPFVEVNATFYRRIPEAYARRWRAAVPRDFTFALKANRDVTHRARLRATPGARAALAHDLRLARILDARYVILETPPSLPLGSEEVAGLRDLLGLADRGPRFGLEARAHAGRPLPAAVAQAMEDLGVLDVADVSRERPRIPSDVVYARLFGKGERNVYEFDDDELRAIDRAGRDAVEIAFTFHGVRMYRDAARFLTFKRTGRFPRATSSLGLESLREVLREDAAFPATREEILRAQGWKVFDLDAATRAHASRILSRLPERRFRSVGEVIEAAQGLGVGST